MNELYIKDTNEENKLIPSKISLDDLVKIEGYSTKIQLAIMDLFCRYKKPKKILEIGTFHGRSSVLFSSYVNENEGVYWGIEPELTLAEITESNCKKVCPNGNVVIERNISNYSDIQNSKSPWFDIVHIDGEHSFTAVFQDLNIVKKVILNDGLIILDDFLFDLYPQITQAVYKWLDENPNFILLAAGGHKGIICNKMHYKEYADIILDKEFITELKKYDTGYDNITITRTSPLMDCPTIGISTNLDSINYYGNECGDGKIERIGL